MILPRKRLLVDIFFTRRLPKSLAFCEFASVNFEPCRNSLDVTAQLLNIRCVIHHIYLQITYRLQKIEINSIINFY